MGWDGIKVVPRRLLAGLAGVLVLGMAPWAALASAAPAPAPSAGAAFIWSSGKFIDHPPFLNTVPIDAMSCATTKNCVGLDAQGDVLTSASPAGGAAAWHISAPSVPAIKGAAQLSCVTASPVLCVGLDRGQPVVSTRPAGGASAWHQVKVAITALGSITCTSKSFCLAAGKGGFEFSANPAGGASAWHSVKIGNGTATFQASCASPSFCAAINGTGDLLTTTHPAGTAAAWKVTHLNGAVPLEMIECPSASLCVASDNIGDVLTSAHPAGGASQWSRAPLGKIIESLTCPSTSECVGTDGTGEGEMVTSTNPAGGASAWHFSTAPWFRATSGIVPLTCPATTLCVAGDLGGDIATSASPAGGLSDWTPVNVDGTNYMSQVTCPSAKSCLVLDSRGNLLTSADPAAGQWKVALHGVDSLACPSASLCVGVGAGNVLTSTNPAGGASAWHSATIAPGKILFGLTCPSVSLCVTSDSNGTLYASANPAGGAPAWTAASPVSGGPFSDNQVRSLVCRPGLCVVSYNQNSVWTSTSPTGGTSAWHQATITGGAASFNIGPFACPSTSLCVGVAGGGVLLTSTNPAAATPSFQSFGPPDGDHFGNPVCSSASLCYSYGKRDGKNVVWFSTNPAGGPVTWRSRPLSSPFPPAGFPFASAFTCFTAKFCIATYSNGTPRTPATKTGVLTSANPAAGGKAWAITTIRTPKAGYVISAVGCAQATLCVAGDSHGDVYVGKPRA
jgi:hypothetical protein